MATTNGTLLAPTNFFGANSNAVKTAIGYTGTDSDTNAVWGNITGTLANQLDLTSTVAKAASASQPGHTQPLSTITNAGTMAGAATGDYYLASNPSSYVDSSVTNGVNTRIDGLTNGAALGETALQPTDSGSGLTGVWHTNDAVPFNIYTNSSAPYSEPIVAEAFAFRQGVGLTRSWNIITNSELIAETTAGFDTNYFDITTNDGIAVNAQMYLNVEGYDGKNPASKDWVRSVMASGVPIYQTTNAVNTFGIYPTNYTYWGYSEVPAVDSSVSMPTLSNGNYCLIMISTNVFLAGTVLKGPASVECYLSRTDNGSADVLTIQPEMYYFYTNAPTVLLGDWPSSAQSITATTTNKYNWTIAYDDVTLTNSAMVLGRMKVMTRNNANTLTMAVGPLYPSRITMPAADTTSLGTRGATNVVYPSGGTGTYDDVTRVLTLPTITAAQVGAATTAQMAAVEGRTGVWDQAATDATFSTNWIGTNVVTGIDTNTSYSFAVTTTQTMPNVAATMVTVSQVILTNIVVTSADANPDITGTYTQGVDIGSSPAWYNTNGWINKRFVGGIREFTTNAVYDGVSRTRSWFYIPMAVDDPTGSYDPYDSTVTGTLVSTYAYVTTTALQANASSVTLGVNLDMGGKSITNGSGAGLTGITAAQVGAAPTNDIGDINMGGKSVTNANFVSVTNYVWLPINGVVYFGTTTNYIRDQGGTNYLFMSGTNSANFAW